MSAGNGPPRILLRGYLSDLYVWVSEQQPQQFAANVTRTS